MTKPLKLQIAIAWRVYIHFMQTLIQKKTYKTKLLFILKKLKYIIPQKSYKTIYQP